MDDVVDVPPLDVGGGAGPTAIARLIMVSKEKTEVLLTFRNENGRNETENRKPKKATF